MKTSLISAMLIQFVLATSVTSLALAWVNLEAAKATLIERWWEHAWRHGWAAGLAVAVVSFFLRR